MVIKLFISGEDKQKDQLNILKEKISKLDHHLKYHTDKVRSLENRKNVFDCSTCRGRYYANLSY